MFLVKEEKGKLYTLPAKEISSFNHSKLAMKIINIIAKKPSYPKEIAKKLNVHEQKIYYHIRNLEKSGIIKILRKEEHGGVLAKIYALTKPSFFMKFRAMEESKKIPKSSIPFLEPFIIDGNINARIVVGSPDPHGPERARSRDAYYAIDLGMFFGTFLINSNPCVTLDTEINSGNRRENLILIGGPVINKMTKMINSKLPIRFDERRNISSPITKKTYKSDDCGIIVKINNPYNKEKKILVVAGKRYSGTRAAILAFLKRFDEVAEGNRINGKDAKVVMGIDNDYDGIVDDVKILE